MSAASVGHADIVTMLLDACASTSTLSAEGETVFYYAKSNALEILNRYTSFTRESLCSIEGLKKKLLGGKKAV